MEISNKKTFSRSKFVSIGLFLSLMVLVATAVIIQFVEAFQKDFFIHLFTVIHIFSGLSFTVLSILHAKIHWYSMRSYIKVKNVAFSKELFYAILLTIMTILIGCLFVCFLMD